MSEDNGKGNPKRVRTVAEVSDEQWSALKLALKLVVGAFLVYCVQFLFGWPVTIMLAAGALFVAGLVRLRRRKR